MNLSYSVYMQMKLLNKELDDILLLFIPSVRNGLYFSMEMV